MTGLCKKRIIITLIATIILSVAACFCLPQVNKVSAVEVEIIDSNIKTQYLVGEQFSLGKVKLDYNGEQVDSTGSYLILPNGDAVSGDNTVLSLDGGYTAVYYAEHDGRYLESKKDFVVLSELYSVKSERSSAVYGKPANYDTEGILLSLYTGDVFTYNKVIDVKDYTNQNGLLTFYAIPETMGVADCTDVIIRLTDAYDDQNFVDVKISNVSYMGQWANPHVYCKGAANGQTFTGINGGIPRQDYCGLSKYFTLTGILSHTIGGPLDSSRFTYSIDYEQRQLWTNGGTETSGMIIDLDDEKIFSEVWKGFTTGECFLSMFGQGYQTLNANYVITEIDGQDITENIFNVNSPVKINIDYGEYSEQEIPKAMVNKPYKIFPAQTESLYQKGIEITTNVIYNYGSEKALNVSIVDGCFTPKLEGYYSIIYAVKDRFGVESKKVVDVYARDKESLSVEYQVLKDDCFIMDEVCVLEISGFENASGNVEHKAQAVLNENVAYELDENFCFKPEYCGTYKIKLTTTDYIETIENEFDFTVNKKDVFAISGQAFVPKYFIKNAKYELSGFDGVNYSNGYPQPAAVEIYYQEDDGQEKKVIDNVITVNAQETIKLIYKINGQTYKECVSEVVDVGYGEQTEDNKYDVTKFFIQKSGQVEYFYKYDPSEPNKKLDNDNLKIRTSENSLVEFVNVVDVNDFMLNFRVGGPESNFNKLNIYLEDCVTGKTLKFTYTENNEKTQFILNDKDWREVELDFNNDKEPVNFMFIYSNLKETATADQANYITIKEYTDGTEYNGFTNGKAYLKIEFEEVEGDSVISIVNFNSQSFSSSRQNKDNVKPMLEVETRSGNVYLNEEFTLFGARYYDVLDPFVSGSVKIKTPNNEAYENQEGIVFDGIDCTKDYLIKFDEYGYYSIEYTITDGAGNVRSYVYGIKVVDKLPPTITLSDVKTTAAKGKEYRIANYVVSDNVTEQNFIKVFVYVIDVGRHYTEIKDGKCVLKDSGEYEIVYMAFDEEFNMAQVSYKVKVS